MNVAENEKRPDVVETGAAESVVAGTRPSAPPRRRRRLLRRLLIGLAVLIVLLVVAVFYATSEHCLRHVILPKVAKQTGRQIALDRFKLRLLRGVEIENLTVGPAAGEPQPLLKLNRFTVQ